MLYNIYWHEGKGEDLKSFANQGLSLPAVLIFVDIILSSGGEVVGIINSAEDN